MRTIKLLSATCALLTMSHVCVGAELATLDVSLADMSAEMSSLGGVGKSAGKGGACCGRWYRYLSWGRLSTPSGWVHAANEKQN